MKRRILLVTLASAIGYVGFSSYKAGPAHSGIGNRTGAKGNTTTNNCSSGGCHGTGTSTAATIRVDSVGAIQVTRYKPGMTYTVTVGGTSTTSQPKYGFQYTAVKGLSTAQTSVGTFAGMPTGVGSVTATSLTFVEHTNTLTATTPGTYSTSFQWTAPAALTGDVTMYLTLNAVDGNGSTSAADISGSVSKVLTEISTVSVEDMNMATVQTYPNPVLNTLNLTFNGAGTYSVNIFDLNGHMVASETVTTNSLGHTASINTANWTPGMYHAVIENNGSRQIVPIVKQ